MGLRHLTEKIKVLLDLDRKRGRSGAGEQGWNPSAETEILTFELTSSQAQQCGVVTRIFFTVFLYLISKERSKTQALWPWHFQDMPEVLGFSVLLKCMRFCCCCNTWAHAWSSKQHTLILLKLQRSEAERALRWHSEGRSTRSPTPRQHRTPGAHGTTPPVSLPIPPPAFPGIAS